MNVRENTTEDTAMTTNETAIICKAGHEVEAGKSVSGKGYCNLCLKDLDRGKAAGTTAQERGLRFVEA